MRDLPAAILLPLLTMAGFRLAGVARTQAWLRRWAAAGRVATTDADARIAAVLRAQRLARRFLGVAGSCLVRSFTLWALLEKRGVSAQLRIGLRIRDGVPEGHAWVEYGNRAINEKESVVQTYTVYPDYAGFDIWKRGGPIL